MNLYLESWALIAKLIDLGFNTLNPDIVSMLFLLNIILFEIFVAFELEKILICWLFLLNSEIMDIGDKFPSNFPNRLMFFTLKSKLLLEFELLKLP